jgi:hypothetical protein
LLYDFFLRLCPDDAIAINAPGQFERIQVPLELPQLRQPTGLGIAGARHALSF